MRETIINHKGTAVPMDIENKHRLTIDELEILTLSGLERLINLRLN